MSKKTEISKKAKEIAKLADTDEFIAMFNRQQQIQATKPEAYQATERIYKKLFGRPKYASYSSFQRVFYRQIKRRATERQAEIKKFAEKQENIGQ